MPTTSDEHRFLLFTGYHFYPARGWEDFCGAYATQEAAHQARLPWQAEGHNWYQIVDVRTLTLVEEGELLN